MTAIQQSKAAAAYKTQWDPVAHDIRDVTKFGNSNTQLCLSYLFGNTVFRGIREFVSYFQENDALKVPAGQELAIWDISVLNRVRVPEMENRSEYPDFLFTTMLAPLAKTCKRVLDKKSTQKFTRAKGFVLTESSGYTLKTVQGDLYIRLPGLFRLMVHCKIPHVKFGNNQKVHLELSKRDLECMQDHPSKNGDAQPRNCCLHSVLATRNPVGFIWSLNFGAPPQLSVSTIGASAMSEGVDMLGFSSPKGMTLGLKPPTPRAFISSIVRYSHAALLAGLKESDAKAMNFLLFRAFFFYLCGDFRKFRSNELPTFFKPEELRRLVPNEQNRIQVEGVNPVIETNDEGDIFQVIDSTAVKIQKKMKDPQLNAAIKELESVEEFGKKMEEILAMSPEEYGDLSLEKLPAPIQLILKEIRALAGNEMKVDSPFICTHLPVFIRALTSEGSTDKKDNKKA